VLSTLTRVTRSRAVRRFLANRVAVGSLMLLVALVLIAVVGPRLAPYDPNDQDLASRLSGPSARHWLGTDSVGRDTLSRILPALGVSLRAAGQALGVAVLIGVPLGLAAGYLRGPADAVLSRVADGLLALPPLIFAFAIVGVLGRGLGNAMLAVGIVLAPRFFRVARGAAVEVREELFMEAARADGCGVRRMVLRHVLPNSLGPLLVQASIGVGTAILAEAALSFLGLGVQSPEASLGSMLQDGAQNLSSSSFVVVPPSAVMTLTVLVAFLLGDGLRDATGRARAGA
jgi:peptide/nickel transport system permease protein